MISRVKEELRGVLQVFKVSFSLCLLTFERKMKMSVVFVIFLHVFQQISAVEIFEGTQFYQLPCEFHTFALKDPTVIWSRQDLSPSTVHQRQPEGDELKEQNQLYTGRTSMKADALDSGDLSLNLTNLELSDSGIYTCTVRDSRLGEQTVADLELKVIERFPSWIIAVLFPLVLVLIIAGGVLIYHRQYLKSDYQVEVDSGVDSVLLPCKTIVCLPYDTKVEWTVGDVKVHVRENSSDQTEEQYEEYTNRTRMNRNLLRKGDLSLILKYPTDQDGKTFTCTVYSNRGSILVKKKVDLEVKVPRVEVEEGAESVLLPFRTTPELPGDAKAVWEDGQNRKVHVYENSSNQPEEQDQFYRNRTRMSKDLLRTGDLSLTLEHPTERDSGRYRCWIRGRHIWRWKRVELKVKGRVQVLDPTEDIRTRSSSTDPTPLIADQSV